MKKVLIIIFIIVVLLCGCSTKKINVEEEYITDLKSLGYTVDQISFLESKLKLEDVNIITEYDYVKNIDSLINDESFKEENLRKYLESYNETNNIKHSLILVNNNISYPYTEKLVTIINDEFFIPSLINRYMALDITDYSKIVKNVNTNRDYEYYQNEVNTDTSKNELMIVNKYYKLDSNYNGLNLVKIASNLATSSSFYMNSEAYSAFKEMRDAGIKEDLDIIIRSAYRSFETQDNLYNRYLDEHGLEWTNKWSARPGYSEHQTGLAIDVVKRSENSLSGFENTDEYNWLKDNSYKYGFILRYDEDNTNYTGYSFEPWHYRYVGVDVATFIYEHNITFEEYYAYFIAN